ncbi:MAG TPA: hypothetical protein VNE16_07295 [Vicinamibacterales bacterium]|nr:hypothetical protein [Vicinamibacterales bacterium]
MVRDLLQARVDQMERCSHGLLAGRSLVQAADGFIGDLQGLCEQPPSALSLPDFQDVCDEVDSAVAVIERFLDRKALHLTKARAFASKIYEIRRLQELALMRLRACFLLPHAPAANRLVA